MADLELRIPCRTALNSTLLVVMWALWPVWALLAPLCIVATVIAVAISPIIFSPALTTALILGSTAVLAAGVLLTALCEDDCLYVCREGMAFPIFLLPFLRFRRNLNWSDLSGADISLPVASEGSERLKLLFKSGAMLSLPLSCFSKTDLEQLLLAIELWGSACARSPDLIEFQRELQNESKGIEKVSYTQLWEDELSRRYSNTSFVPLEPGTTLYSGQLKVLRQLAFGGLSAIYLARFKDKDFVVLKEAVVPASADFASRRKAEEHFVREASLLMALSHPNIATVRDHFVDGGRNYLLLDYINGQDLRQYVRQNGPQEERRVLQWALEITDILEYLHTRTPPVVHRDLTPDNLMLCRDGRLTLIDFGAANQLIGSATGTLVGKQAYMAPEQLRGKSSQQSDFYALGATLHFLLSGFDPVPLAVSHPKELMPAISTEMDLLIARLTSFAACDRQGSAKSVREEIEKIYAACGPCVPGGVL